MVEVSPEAVVTTQRHDNPVLDVLEDARHHNADEDHAE